MYFYSPWLCFFIVLPRFFQIFSIFLFIFISKRHNPWDILFFIFSPVFLFPGGFSLIFLFYRPGCTFSVFYRFIWFHYNFSVFMVLIFFSRCHVFYPLFHLSGLPFSFFCKQSHFFSFINIFHSFSPFFYPSSPFHTIFLPFTASPSRFYSFRSCLYYIFPFSVVFCLFSTHFYLFLLFPPLPSFYTLFLPFFRSSFIFSFLLMSLSPSHFSRFTSLQMFHVKHRFLRFSVFGNQWEVIYFPAFRKSLSFFTSLIFKTIVFSILFWFSPFFYIFPVFSCVSRSFSSLFSLFY